MIGWIVGKSSRPVATVVGFTSARDVTTTVSLRRKVEGRAVHLLLSSAKFACAMNFP